MVIKQPLEVCYLIDVYISKIGLFQNYAYHINIQTTDMNNGQMKEMPIAYLSSQFSDTQFKWSTVVKEGYSIYMAIKKWRHYLEDAEILLKSDAKSLQKFLNGKTNNLKLDRWSLELQGRNIR